MNNSTIVKNKESYTFLGQFIHYYCNKRDIITNFDDTPIKMCGTAVVRSISTATSRPEVVHIGKDNR